MKKYIRITCPKHNETLTWNPDNEPGRPVVCSACEEERALALFRDRLAELSVMGRLVPA